MDLARLRQLSSLGSLRLTGSAGLPIAIDFGASSLKILQVAAGDVPTLVSAACIQTPDDLLSNPAKRLSFQIEALPNLIKAGGFKGKRAVCGIPAGHTIVKHMQSTRVQGVSLAETIEQALCLQLGAPSGSVLVRHFEVETPSRSGSGSKSEVICIAAARALVTELMKAIKEARLEPVGIHSEPVATLRAFQHINRREEDQRAATLYLDIGAQTTNLTIGHADRLVFARKIDFGGHALDELMHKHTGCGIAKARARRIASEVLVGAPAPSASTGIPALDAAVASNGAELQPDQAAIALSEDRREGRPAPGLTPDVLEQPIQKGGIAGMDLSEPLEILADEISMCQRYHASLFPDVPLARAVFLGGEARHLGLCQHVARAVRLPAQAADPMARVLRTGTERVVGVDFATPQPGWTIPLGLCLCPTDL